MTDPRRLEQINNAMWEVQHARREQMKLLIKEAVSNGIHVEIIVSTEPGLIVAQELWEYLGFPKGSSDFTHVTLDKPPFDRLWSTGKGLSINYSSITCPRM